MSKKTIYYFTLGGLFSFSVATVICWFMALMSGLLSLEPEDYTSRDNWLFVGSFVLPLLAFIAWAIMVVLEGSLEREGKLERRPWSE